MKEFMVFVLLLNEVIGGKASVFNIDEINYLKYGINLDSKPVTKPKAAGPEHMIMTSKYGQKYSCLLPEVKTKETKDLEFENILNSFSVKFNKPETCLHRTQHWWTYRVCYGNIIQQYHQPDRRKQRQLPKHYITIGTFDRDLDWESELEKPDTRYYEQLSHSHKQYYNNGDICDDTGLPRKAVVSFACDPGTLHDFISYIAEIEVCSYRIVINTARMCAHKFFLPGHGSIKHNINCSPLVESIPTYTSVRQTGKPKKRDMKYKTEPSWVGNYPTTPNYSLRNYIEDLLDEDKRNTLKYLKNMFKNAVNNLKADITSRKAKVNAKVHSPKVKDEELKNSELQDVNLDELSDKDIDIIFKSDDIENTVNKLAESTQQEINNIKTAAIKSQPKLEIKVIYRNADGDVLISDSSGESPDDMRHNVLQLMDYNSERREQELRHQAMINSYHFHSPDLQDPSSDDTLQDTSADDTSDNNPYSPHHDP